MFFPILLLVLRTTSSRLNKRLLFGAFFLILLILILCICSFVEVPIQYAYWDYMHPLVIVCVFYLSFKSRESIESFIAFQSVFFIGFTVAWLVLSLFIPFFSVSDVATSSDGPDSLRIGAYIGNPNTLGYMLNMFYPFFLSRFIIARKVHALSLCSVFLIWILVMLTNSRSSLLILFLTTLFVLFLLSGFLKPLQIIALLSLPIPLSISIYFAYSTGLLLLGRISEKLFFDSSRNELWQGFIHTYQQSSWQSKLLGSGPAFYSRSKGVIFDSYYFKLLLELGILPLMLFTCLAIFLYFLSVRYCLCDLKYSIDSLPCSLVFCTIGLIVLIAGYSSQILDVFPFNMFAFAYLGLFIKYSSPWLVRSRAHS